MNEKYTIYTLNENCIADSLTADLGEKQRLAVPHLSVLNGAFNDITNGRTDALVVGDFLDDGRLSVWYDENTKKMYLGGKNQDRERVISLDCSPFIVDGMINSVSIVDEDPTTTPPTHGVFIEIIWNTDSGHAPTYINVKSVIGGLYTGDGKYINVDENLSISFDSGKFIKNFKENSDGLSNTYDTLYKNYQFLAGLDGDYTSGAIGQMSSDIENLKGNGINGLKYLKDIDDAVELGANDSLSSFLQSEIGGLIENGTYLPVRFDEDTTVELEDGLKVCNGDAVIIHVDGNTRYIPVESIKLGINASVQKGGVSRYEYNKNKDNISQLRTDVDTISNDVSSIIGNVNEISGKVDNKVFIVNPDVNLSDYSDLSVVKLGKEEYETLVAGGDSLDPRTIYIVNSEVIDAYGQKVINVQDASGLSDAVNLKLLRKAENDVHDLIEDTVNGLSTEKEILSSENGRLSVITEINETSGVISIRKSMLEKNMVNGLVETIDVISGNVAFISGIVDGSAKLKVGSYVLTPIIPTENYASAYAAVAEGAGTSALGIGSHSEGIGSLAIGYASHVEGADNINGESQPGNEEELLYPIASGYASHAEGVGYAKGDYSHAEGGGNDVLSNNAALSGDWFDQPTRPTAEGKYSHAEGTHTWARGDNSHAEGDTTLAAGKHSHAECGENKSIGDYSHTEGKKNIASGNISHAEGWNTTASEECSHSEGNSTKANGKCSHAEGWNTTASVNYSHSEGNSTKANGECSHAEGKSTTASANYSHAEGQGTKTSGTFSHAEGYQSETGNINPDSYSEGAHAEGYQTKANGDGAHSEGRETTAKGIGSHSEGHKTNASNNYEHAQGTYNVTHTSTNAYPSNKNTIHSIGIGTGDNAKKNSIEVMQNGDVYVISVGGYDGNNLTGNTLQQTITNLSGRVDKQKIVDYYNESGLSGYDDNGWRGLSLNQMGEMLSVLFTAICK